MLKLNKIPEAEVNDLTYCAAIDDVREDCVDNMGFIVRWRGGPYRLKVEGLATTDDLLVLYGMLKDFTEGRGHE